jgi:hypothetical protein
VSKGGLIPQTPICRPADTLPLQACRKAAFFPDAVTLIRRPAYTLLPSRVGTLSVLSPGRTKTSQA